MDFKGIPQRRSCVFQFIAQTIRQTHFHLSNDFAQLPLDQGFNHMREVFGKAREGHLLRDQALLCRDENFFSLRRQRGRQVLKRHPVTGKPGSGGFLDHHRGSRARNTLSPLLTGVLDALQGIAAGPVPATSSASSRRTVIRTAKPGHGFDLAARYSDAGRAYGYRARASALLDGPMVTYRQKRDAIPRANAKPYGPESLPREFHINALFDRMVIAVSVRRWVPFRTLKAAADGACGASVYVKDLTEQATELERLAEGGVVLTRVLGRYEIQVQEPTPEKISALLKAIDARCGLTGMAEIALLELALDFIPAGTPTPAEHEVFRDPHGRHAARALRDKASERPDRREAAPHQA